MEIAAESAEDAPKATPSERTINDATKRRQAGVSVVGADFVRGRDNSFEDGRWGHVKSKATKFLSSIYLANTMLLVVFLDAYCTVRDIDARASSVETPPIFGVLSDLCLLLYTAELLLRIFIHGLKVLRDWMMCLDLFIVLCGYLEMVLELANVDGLGGMSVIRAVRLVRIFRLIRLLRKIRTLRELHKLATMMATCAKTLVWSFLLLSLVMTLWSMLMVEIVHPLLLELGDLETSFGTCKRCDRAMASVMEANLLLFKTVIAGDSWGEIAVPVIENYPATAIIFMGSLLTLVFGVLNLIVAVVVDTFADARQNDVQNLAEEMEDEIANDRKSLAKLFDRIDLDGSGQLTLEELIEGAQRDSDFQSRLRVMDIDENDLQLLFEMIDADNSGTIEAAEFIGPLSRWAHDSKTAPRFIKYNMLQTMQMQEDLWDMCADCFKHLALQIDKVHLEVKALGKGKRKKGSKERSDDEKTPERSLGLTPPRRDEVAMPGFRATISDVVEDVDEVASGPFLEPPSRLSQTSFEKPEFPLVPEADLFEEMEHMMGLRPSRQTEMLSEKSRESKNMTSNEHHLDLLLESAVSKLEASMKKMEKLAHTADIMVRKWHEAPNTQRRNGTSTSTSSRKSDVFWALYMDRDHLRERRQKRRHTTATQLPRNSGARNSIDLQPPERLAHRTSEMEKSGASGASGISMSFASSIMDDLEEEPELTK